MYLNYGVIIMLKLKSKLTVSLLSTLLFVTNIYAISSVSIKNATPEEIRAFLLKNTANMSANYTVANNSENNLTFIGTSVHNTGLFGQYSVSQENTVDFNYMAQDDGTTLLTYNESATVYNPINGARFSQPIGTKQTELNALNQIKAYFDGIYKLGIDIIPKKQKGGFPLTDVDLEGPAYAAGLRDGDILLKVNGNKIAYDKNYNIFNFTTEPNYPTTLLLTIQTIDKQIKDIPVTTWFVEPKTFKFRKP